jgi:hypothetical protein
MSQATTYPELSEDGGGAHEFYEVPVAATTVSIRYGGSAPVGSCGP